MDLTKPNIYYFDNQEHSDVTLIFPLSNNQTIHIHSEILLRQSDKFEELLSTASNGTITITDVDYSCFREFLRAIYCEELHLNELNISTIMDLSRKYNLISLEEVCATKLSRKFTISTICSTLNKHVNCKSTIFKTKILEYIGRRLSIIIKHPEFLKCSYDALVAILSIEKCDEVIEREIFIQSMKWADERCIEERVMPNGVNRRRFLKDSIKLIRFMSMCEVELCFSILADLEMSPKEIPVTFSEDEFITNGTLSLEESCSLVSRENSFGFIEQPRESYLIDLLPISDEHLEISTESLVDRGSSSFTHNSNGDVRFIVNQMCYITKVEIRKAFYLQNVTIQFFSNDNEFIGGDNKFFDMEKARWIVNLTKPVLIDPDVEHKMVIFYNREYTEILTGEFIDVPMTRNCDDVEFHFVEYNHSMRGIYFRRP